MRARIGFLLGRPPGAGSIHPEVLRRLAARGMEVSTHILGPERSQIPDVLLGADVVALRGLRGRALEAVRGLEEQGVRCCNRVAATDLARDKAAVNRALAGARIPVPESFVVTDWEEVASVGPPRGLVVKAVDGSRGRGVVLLERGQASTEPPFPGPFLVEDRIDHDGLDRKLYVIGDVVIGVLRRWPPRTLADRTGKPFDPGPGLRSLSLGAGRALGLEIFGVDVLVGPAGASVVDVNAFPGFKGAVGAADVIAGYLAELARGGEAAACAS